MDIVSYLLGKQASGGGGSSDVHKYIRTEINSNNDQIDIKILPTITIADNVTWISQSNFAQVNPEEIENITGGASLTSMASWFYSKNILKKATITEITSQNINSLQSLFAQCVFLEEVDMNIYSEKITNTGYMFQSCGYLKNIDFSWLSTSLVTNSTSMFQGCESLKTIDISNIGTNNNLMCGNMFLGCSSLEKIDMRNFDFTKSIAYSGMFTSVPTDCEIIVKDDTQKSWLATNFSSLTNVKTVAEL